MPKFALAVLAFLLLAAPAAVAQAAPTVDAAGAAEVKKMVEEALAFQLDMAEKTGDGLVIDGEVSVTPKDSYYEVGIPGAKLRSQLLGVIEIGTILLNVSHGKAEGEYLASMALPSAISFHGVDGSRAQIRLGKQKFAGAWQAPLRSFTRLDAEYDDILITAVGEQAFALRLGKLKTILNLQEEENGTWSGPNDFAVSDIEMTVPGDATTGETVVKVEGLIAKATYDQFNLRRVLEIESSIKSALSDPARTDDADLKALTSNLVKEDDVGFFNGMENTLEMQGVSISVAPAPNSTETPKSFKIGSVTTKFILKGLQQEEGSAAMAFGMKGLDIADNEIKEMGYMPTEASFELYLDKLPMQSLSKTVSDLLEGLMQTMELSDAAVAAGDRPLPRQFERSQIMAAVLAVPQMLASAGSSLSIRNTYMKAPELDAKLDGTFKANAAARYVGVGSMTLVLQGLDELILKLQASQNPMAQRAVGGLSVMQMMGQQDTADGKSLRRYKLEVTPEGKVLLNGNDVSALQGMMGGAR